MKHTILNALKLCLVTKPNYHSISESQRFVEAVLRGGVTMVQVRDKSADYHAFKAHACVLQQVVAQFNVPLIINDNVMLAREIGADGVHVGQSDMHPDRAREILGPHAIIGLSIESEEELEVSTNLTSIDYISASAVFASKTKTNYKRLWGFEGVEKMVKNAKHPVIGIGGITINNASNLLTHGAVGIAVIGALYDAPNPSQVARELRKIIDTNKIYSHE